MDETQIDKLTKIQSAYLDPGIWSLSEKWILEKKPQMNTDEHRWKRDY